MEINRTVLLVLDMQERLLPVICENEKLIHNVIKLIKGVNLLNIPVIYTEQYPKGLGETCLDIKENLENAKYFSKDEFSAFPSLEKELIKLKTCGVDTIIVVGVETHICVYQTIRDLIDAEFNVIVPFDAVSSRDVCNYENGISLLREEGASVRNIETILFDLLKSSRHSEFKSISKLIK